jgi:hypothetical protein
MSVFKSIGDSFDKIKVGESSRKFINEAEMFINAYEKVGLEKMYGHEGQLKKMQGFLDDFYNLILSHEDDFIRFMQNGIEIKGEKMTIFAANGVITQLILIIHEITGKEVFQIKNLS